MYKNSDSLLDFINYLATLLKLMGAFFIKLVKFFIYFIIFYFALFVITFYFHRLALLSKWVRLSKYRWTGRGMFTILLQSHQLISPAQPVI